MSATLDQAKARLRSTTASEDVALAEAADATQRRSQIQIGLRDDEDEKSRLEHEAAAFHLAEALSEVPPAGAPDAAKIVTLTGRIEGRQRALPQALANEDEKVRAAERVTNARNQAAARFATIIAVEPAEAKVRASWEAVGSALAEYMGADMAARFHYSASGHADELGGQATRLIRHLLAFDWRTRAPALRPGWLDHSSLIPSKMPGVAEAQAAVIDAVEEAAR